MLTEIRQFEILYSKFLAYVRIYLLFSEASKGLDFTTSNNILHLYVNVQEVKFLILKSIIIYIFSKQPLYYPYNISVSDTI